MAYHSHERGNKGYGGSDRSRGDTARALPTFEQEAEAARKRQEAVALLGGDLPALEETPAPEPAPLLPAVGLTEPPTQEEPPPFGGRARKPKTKPAGSSSGPGYTIIEADISELIEDPNNARRHNPRNIGLIADAIHEVGVARSVVIDEDYLLMAGNGAKEAAAEVGIRKVIIVQTDGETLVAVQRVGLTSRQKTRLALFDNRASDLSEFDPVALTEIDLDDETLLEGIFNEDEISGIAAMAALEGSEDGDEDGPLFPPEGVSAGKGAKAKRLAFRLEFDSAAQMAEFERFRKWLRRSYGQDDSEAARFMAFIYEHSDAISDRPE